MQNKCNNNIELIFHVLLNSHLNSNSFSFIIFYVMLNVLRKNGGRKKGNTSSTGSALT